MAEQDEFRAKDVGVYHSQKPDSQAVTFGREEEERRATRAKRRSDRDWTHGSIVGNLWSLSWPIMITQTVTTLGPTFDMIWVGKLGAVAIAGVGISGMIVQMMNTVRMGLQTGTRALVARYVGAGDEEEANNIAQQTLVVTIGFAIFMAVIGIFLARQMLLLLGVETGVVAEGAAYLRIQLVGMVTMSFVMMAQSIMQASGDSVTPMYISIGYRIFHIILCPLLIFGWWIFPRLGVSGAALTGVISQALGGALGMWMLYSGRTRLRLTMKGFHFDWGVIWRIVKIGIPAVINGTGRTSVNLVVTWFVVPFGTFAVAAHSLMQRIDQLVQMPAMGLGQGAGVLAGQNLGAGEPDRAERTGWLSAILFTGIMFICSALVWAWPRNVVSIFDSEPDLVEVASIFLKIQIVQYMMFGFTQVLMQCLNGVGDTMIPMLNTLITLWGIQVPLAYFIPQFTSLGVYGVRWAMVISVTVRALIFIVYFRVGRWKRMKV
jgi:putative MATE family efflux protein